MLPQLQRVHCYKFFTLHRANRFAVANHCLLLLLHAVTVQFKRGRAYSSSTALHSVSLPSSDFWSSVSSDVRLPWDAFLRGPFSGDTTTTSVPAATQRRSSTTSSNSSATTTAERDAAVLDTQRQQQQQQQQQLAASSIR
jgi:hypothetical protein